MKKNGRTSKGTTRWRCPTSSCGASTTRAGTRADVTRRHEFAAFIEWITGKDTQSAGTMSARTFRRRTRWCWNVAPTMPATGAVDRYLMLDGTYFNGWCVLVAYNGAHVTGWQWCDREKRASWDALITRLPAPDIAVIDGNGPLASAIQAHWPDTARQRCYFHIRQAAHKHLTRKPKLIAGRELLALIKALGKVSTTDQASAWTSAYSQWWSRWDDFAGHRTHARDGAIRPSHVKPGQKWWYTHLRLRRARKLIDDLIRHDELFTWLSQAVKDEVLPRTTNPLEGGINAGIKDVLRAHRGLRDDHARRAVEWYLYQRTENPADPWEHVRPEHWQPAPRTGTPVEGEPIGPTVYDTSFSWEDGNGIQSGWGGRRR